MSRVLDLLSPAHGQCYLSRQSATVLVLLPRNGNVLNVNGLPERVPVGGVTVANTGMSANTVYFVYAYMAAGVMTLELSATGHTASAMGVETKTGDTSRTLFGKNNGGTAALFLGGQNGEVTQVLSVAG
jgi:hypothetical protein